MRVSAGHDSTLVSEAGALVRYSCQAATTNAGAFCVYPVPCQPTTTSYQLCWPLAILHGPFVPLGNAASRLYV